MCPSDRFLVQTSVIKDLKPRKTNEHIFNQVANYWKQLHFQKNSLISKVLQSWLIGVDFFVNLILIESLISVKNFFTLNDV